MAKGLLLGLIILGLPWCSQVCIETNVSFLELSVPCSWEELAWYPVLVPCTCPASLMGICPWLGLDEQCFPRVTCPSCLYLSIVFPDTNLCFKTRAVLKRKVYISHYQLKQMFMYIRQLCFSNILSVQVNHMYLLFDNKCHCISLWTQ